MAFGLLRIGEAFLKGYGALTFRDGIGSSIGRASRVRNENHTNNYDYMLIPGSPSCWSLYRLSGGTFLMALACTLPGGASAANVGAYIAVAPGNSQPTPNSFEVFNSTNIAARVDVPEPSFRAQFSYSGRDWEEYSEPPRSKRIPTDPNRFQHIVF